jgi:hypothetical protein
MVANGTCFAIGHLSLPFDRLHAHRGASVAFENPDFRRSLAIIALEALRQAGLADFAGRTRDRRDVRNVG